MYRVVNSILSVACSCAVIQRVWVCVFVRACCVRVRACFPCVGVWVCARVRACAEVANSTCKRKNIKEEERRRVLGQKKCTAKTREGWAEALLIKTGRSEKDKGVEGGREVKRPGGRHSSTADWREAGSEREEASKRSDPGRVRAGAPAGDKHAADTAHQKE